MIKRIALFAAMACLAVACGGGSSGPDLPAAISSIESMQSAATGVLTGTVDGVDDVWTTPASVAEAADVISSKERPDERTDDAGGDVFLLYPSGTVWVTDASTGDTAVALYESNDTAYSRHSTVLVASRSWGTRLGGYRSGSGGSSGGNGFRGGGSSSGK